MKLFKKISPSLGSFTLLYCMWTGWLLLDHHTSFTLNTYAYLLTATALGWCFLLVPLISNRSYLFKLAAVLVPYVTWTIWFSGQTYEYTQPDLFISLLVTGIVVFIVASLVMATDLNAVDKDLLAHGEKALAKVLAIEDNNVTINDNQYSVKITLEVSSASRGIFTLVINMLVPRLHVPQVGETITVLFDPTEVGNMIMVP